MAENFLEKDTGLLFQILSGIAPVGPSLRHDIERLLKGEALPKKHRLLTTGQVARRIYFIKQGFARAYYHDETGKENTLWFMGAGDVMISVYSFFTQQAAFENIELLADSELQSIAFDELEEVYANHPVFNCHGRKLTETYYIRSEERAIMLRQRKPKARYELLLKTHPDILQQASLTQIASYLSIDLATLSRLRGELKFD